jgi:hypothetical protein
LAKAASARNTTSFALLLLPLDEFPEAEPLVQFADHNQATVGSDPRSLEIDLQRGVEGELKGLILFLTHWVSASGAS